MSYKPCGHDGFSAACVRCYQTALDRIEELEAEVEAWKSASGLVDSSGDPDGVTPKGMREYWEGIEARVGNLQEALREIRETNHAGPIDSRSRTRWWAEFLERHGLDLEDI